MRPTKLAALAALSMTTVALATTPAAALAAPPVTCGSTVITDVTLTNDLICSGPGLIVGADGITIDLGGHTLAGSGATSSTDTGIRAEGHSDLRIRRGTITGFRRAVELLSVENVLLHRLRLTGNAPGGATLFIELGNDIQITDSLVSQPADRNAISAQFSAVIRIQGLRASGEITTDTVRQLSVTRSVLTDGRVLLASTYTIEFRDNVLRRYSVLASQAGDLTIVDNRFTGPTRYSAIGLDLVNNPVIERNFISGTTRGIAINVLPVTNARIAHNVFLRNHYGVTMVDRDMIGQNLLITENQFTENRQAGIFIEATNLVPNGGPLTLTQNTFVRNGRHSTDTDAAGRTINDGIHTNVPIGSPLTISNNRTYFNADHGIEALPAGSVIDGGGNQSTADPNGCAGVTCT